MHIYNKMILNACQWKNILNAYLYKDSFKCLSFIYGFQANR